MFCKVHFWLCYSLSSNCQLICHDAIQNKVQTPYFVITIFLLSHLLDVPIISGCPLLAQGVIQSYYPGSSAPIVAGCDMSWCFFTFCLGSPYSHISCLTNIYFPRRNSREFFSMKPFLIPILSPHTIHCIEFYYTYLFTCFFSPTKSLIPRGKRLHIIHIKTSKDWHSASHIEEYFTNAYL